MYDRPSRPSEQAAFPSIDGRCHALADELSIKAGTTWIDRQPNGSVVALADLFVGAAVGQLCW